MTRRKSYGEKWISMRSLRNSLSLILLLTALAASAANINAQSKERAEKHESRAAIQTDSANNEKSQVPLAALESAQAALLEALRTIKAREETQREQARTQNKTWWYLPWLTPLRIQRGLLIVGVIYTVFAGLQWATIRGQSRIMRDQLESAQRAFVFLRTFEYTRIVDQHTGQPTLFEFMPQWENSGITPTRGLFCHASMHWRDDPLPDDFAFPDQGDQTQVPTLIGPHGTMFGGPLRISPEILALVQSRTKYLYLYGWAKYRDVFKGTKQHITKFCFEVTEVLGELTDPHVTIRCLMRTYPRHNCADDDCGAKD